MASIADLLGVQWDKGSGDGNGFSMSSHAARQATQKGFDHNHVLAAANDPHHTYANGRYPGQMRHIRNGIVAVVEPESKRVVTVYADVQETAPRPDQKDADAQKYARNWRGVGGRH